MIGFPKIETLYNRDKETFRVIEGDYRRVEFALINSWHVTEKIDGTNIRLHYHCDPDYPADVVRTVGGRTDKADIQKPLITVLRNIAEDIQPAVEKIMEQYDLTSYTLFGEGYGPGIQKGGGRYRKDPGFILFDVLINDRQWLGPDRVAEAADRLGLNLVPVLGYDWSLEEIVRLVKGGYASDAAESFDPEFKAEGIIAKTAVPLYTNPGPGHRVIFKLKERDFVGGKF